MMKRILTMLTAILLSTSLYAAPQTNYTYGSTMHPIEQAVKNTLHPPTDITVVNASNDYIYAIIPNSPVYDYVQPGFNDHIYHYDPNLYWHSLVLQDRYNNTFYSASVCRLAIVTVYGYAGHYRVNNDSDLCN